MIARFGSIVILHYYKDAYVIGFTQTYTHILFSKKIMIYFIPGTVAITDENKSHRPI